MKNLALIAAAAMTVATFGAGAIAIGEENVSDFQKADGNNDLMVTFDEARGSYPTLSEDLFAKADTNADGSLDEAEFTGLVGLSAGLDGQGSDDTSAQVPAATMSSSEGNDGTSTPSSSSSSAQ
ncbi:MAG: hypothetical protein ABIQ30_09675 [Devosia sp.]